MVRAKVLGEDLAGMEQVAADQHEVHPFPHGIGHDRRESGEKVLVALGPLPAGAVGLPEMDIRGVDESNGHVGMAPAT